MVDTATWHDIEDGLVYKTSDEFEFCSGTPDERLEWLQYDSRGRPFLITVRNDLGRVILAWGWERSTLHDAVEWTTRKPHSSDAESAGMLKEVFTTEEQIVELIKQEIRRVAEFGSYELKRQLEFAELKAAFERVAEEWEKNRQSNYGRLPGIVELPAELPLALEFPDQAECVLTHGFQGETERRLWLRKDKQGWRINVQEPYTIGPEIWRFTEETLGQPKDVDVVHSSDLVEELTRALEGV